MAGNLYGIIGKADGRDRNMRPLVSIISPCYNGEKYVGRMLESILHQSYENIELLCIDDGSTDRTAEVVLNYQQRFEQTGKKLCYFRRDHEGQAAALNYGLKKISGEYLSWIDCDDFLTPDSVEKKACALTEHPEYEIVTSNLYMVDENDITHPIQIKGEIFRSLNVQPRQFFLTLSGMSLMECHCHMIRVDAFKRINPELEISRCRAGQNYQMLLPMYYFYNRYFIAEPLAYYVIRKDSHYHSKRTSEEELERLEELLGMLEETFRSMGIPRELRERYKKQSTFMAEKRKLLENWRKEGRGRAEEMVRK